jgi:hypothetical protein
MTREQALDTLARLHAELTADPGARFSVAELLEAASVVIACRDAITVREHERRAVASVPHPDVPTMAAHAAAAAFALGLGFEPARPHPFEGVTLALGCTQCFNAAATATNRRGEWAGKCTACGSSWLALAGDARELDRRAAAEVSR